MEVPIGWGTAAPAADPTGANAGRESGQHPWPGLEVRHLAALEAVSREGSFRGAADALGYVQSAISQQIAMLERAVGARLVDRARGRRGVMLTAAGRLLVEHGSDVIDRLYAARADLAALTDELPPVRRVGVDQSLAARLVPAFLRELERVADSTAAAVSELDDGEDPASYLRTGVLDLAIGELAGAGAPLTTEHLLDDPYVLLVHPASPLAARTEPLGMRELAGLPLVAVLGPRQAERLRTEALDQGVVLEIMLQTRAAVTGWALVSDGRAVAIGARSALDLGLPNVTAIALEGVLPARPIAVAWHGDRLVCEEIETWRSVVRASLSATGLGSALTIRFTRQDGVRRDERRLERAG